MALAYIGLGSNLDHPEQQIAQALNGLRALRGCRLLRQSSLYRSAPWGLVEQPSFVNAVAEIETALTPVELLDGLLALERAQGRDRSGVRWGPRRIDLDLLLHGSHLSSDPQLELPHPRIAERSFVLVPLAELAPHLFIPGQGAIAELLLRVDVGDCVRLDCPR